MSGRILFLAVLAALVSGCGGDGPSPGAPEADRGYLIGIAISMTDETPFFISLIEGAAEAAVCFDARIIAVYADEDAAVQSSQIIDLASRGIDVLLLNPVSSAVNPAVDEMAELGIPVITVDRGIDSDMIACHISSDNVAGGKMAGDYLAEALHRSGRVVEIMGTEGSSAAIERGQGFKASIADYPDIELVASFHADFSRTVSEREFGLVLAEHPDIDGVFAHNDDMILGAVAAAEEAGAGGIMFVGFDAIDEAVNAVETGRMLATVAQRPREMGRLGVETAVQCIAGSSVPDSIIVALALILR